MPVLIKAFVIDRSHGSRHCSLTYQMRTNTYRCFCKFNNMSTYNNIIVPHIINCNFATYN